MKHLQFLFFLILTLLLVRCSDDEDVSVKPSPLDLPVITGFQVRDYNGSVRSSYGSPNIKLRDRSEESGSTLYFSVYPNPVEKYCSVYTDIPNNNAERHLWIVPAIYQGDEPPSYSDMGMINFSAEGTPVIDITFTTEYYRLNLSDLETGFYKVYLEVGNSILNDNLVIIHK